MTFRRRWIGSLVAFFLAAWMIASPMPRMTRAADEAKPAAEAAGEAHHGGDPSPLSIDTDLAVWTFVVFFVLLAVLAKFAWGPITEALDKRERHIAENIAAAQRAQDDARNMLAGYERKLAGAADEVRAMLEEAR